MTQTVGDFIVARLHEWDVRRMFGYPGDGINGVFGAMRRAQDRSISFRRDTRKWPRSWPVYMRSLRASLACVLPHPGRERPI